MNDVMQSFEVDIRRATFCSVKVYTCKDLIDMMERVREGGRGGRN